MSSQEDAYKYWQSKLKSGEKGPKASESENEELDEEFSGSEVKFSGEDDGKDGEFSMDEDEDFAISTSIKQAPVPDKNPSSSKKREIETAKSSGA